ncbi:MAG TPA: response regulator transcription factor [Bacteroidota bacterium]|nr:response regulator transcription factor [Bacteroidota bacterium]
MKKDEMIRVVIVEDDDDMRTNLRHFIDTADGFACVGAFERCEDSLGPIADDLPDVILMDINLPGMSGIDGVRRIKFADPEANILMLTVYQDDESIFRSICAGASGYLLKKTPRAVLLSAIREIYSGGAPMTADIARRVMELFRRTAGPAQQDSSLTQRELDILQALVDGCSYKLIAGRYEISIDTVRNHIRHIYEKLHVHSKSEAVAKALKERLV